MGYRYTDEWNKPLTKCPNCGKDLTVPGGIELIIVLAEQSISVPSNLDEHGVLADTEDNAIENGYHSVTACAGCEEYLLNIAMEWPTP